MSWYELPETAAMLREALEISPDDQTALRRLSDVALRRGDLTEALTVGEGLLVLSPSLRPQ